MLDKKTVEHVSKLARLKLSDAELTSFSEVLSAVFENFEQISKVDTKDVIPLATPTDMPQFLRPDEIEWPADPDKMLANAPEKSGRLFKVPPVVG